MPSSLAFDIPHNSSCLTMTQDPVTLQGGYNERLRGSYAPKPDSLEHEGESEDGQRAVQQPMQYFGTDRIVECA